MVPNPTMNGLGLFVYTWSSPTCVVDQVTKILFVSSIHFDVVGFIYESH
jgi:hypothetical protein